MERTFFGSRHLLEVLCTGRVLLAVLLVAGWSASDIRGQAPSVRLLPIEGEAVEGNLLSADSKQVILEVYGGTREWESQKILKLELGRKGSSPTAPLELGLLDGSTLQGTQLIGREEAWQFVDTSGVILELGPGTLRSLRVRSLSPDLANAWSDALKETAESDSLILIRPGNVVDRVGGIISAVNDGKIAFDLGGELVDVPFDKLLGAIWFRKVSDRVKPKVEIQFIDSSCVFTDSLSVAQGNLTYRSVSDKDVVVPLSRIAALNYASANVRWLAEVPVLGSQSDQRIEWKGDAGRVGKVMAPQFVVSDRNGLVDASASPEDLDLVFPSAGSFIFRVPDGFSRFRSRLERSGAGNARSELLIEVLQDDQNISQLVLDPKDERKDLDVAVSGGKKVTLKVSSKSRLQVGCQLTWQQPRLTR